MAVEEGKECDDWASVIMEAYSKLRPSHGTNDNLEAELCQEMVCYFEFHNKTAEDTERLDEWANKYISKSQITEVAQLEDFCLRILNTMDGSYGASKLVSKWREKLISVRANEASVRGRVMSASNEKLSTEMKAALSPPANPITVWTAQHIRLLSNHEPGQDLLEQLGELGFDRHWQGRVCLPKSLSFAFVPIPLGFTLEPNVYIILAL